MILVYFIFLMILLFQKCIKALLLTGNAQDAKRILGEDCRPHYISNRINEYYTVSQDWLKFFNNRYFLKSFSVITPHPSGMMNLIFERMFYRRKIFQVTSLHDAFEHIEKIQTESV